MALCSVTISRILPTLLNVSFNMNSIQVLDHGPSVLSKHLVGFHLTWDRDDTPFIDWQDNNLLSNPIWTGCIDDNSRNDVGIGCFANPSTRYIDITDIQDENAIEVRTLKPPFSSTQFKAGVVSEINPYSPNSEFAYLSCDVSFGASVLKDVSLYRISPTIAILVTLISLMCLFGTVLLGYASRRPRTRIDVGTLHPVDPRSITASHIVRTTQAQRNSKPSSRHGIVMASQRNRIQPREILHVPTESPTKWIDWFIGVFGRMKTGVTLDVPKSPPRSIVAAQGRSVPRSRADVASGQRRASSTPRSRADVASGRRRASSTPRSRADVELTTVPARSRTASSVPPVRRVALTESKQVNTKVTRPPTAVRSRSGSTPRSRADVASGNGRSLTPRSQTPRSQTPRSQTPRSQTPRSQTPRSQTSRSQTPRSQTPRMTQQSRSPPETTTTTVGYAASLMNWASSVFVSTASETKDAIEIVTVPVSQKSRSSSTPRSRNHVRNSR